MSKPSSSLRHSIFVAALLPLLSLALSACGSPTAVPQTRPCTYSRLTGHQHARSRAKSGRYCPEALGYQRRHGHGRTRSRRYNLEPGEPHHQRHDLQLPLSARLDPDLSYCAPGAARSASGSQLPARCTSTDILVGQKARDVGTLTGQNITLDGKQAIKQIDRSPRNGQAELIYTVLVYDPSGAPLAGFSTSIGPGTDAATTNNIVSVLTRLAGTLVVGR